MLDKHLLCVTGLPCSGSTLLCQSLAHDSLVYCPGHSSPFCPTLAVQNPDSQLQQHLHYVMFERWVSEPVTVMQGIFQWLVLSPAPVDLQDLSVQPHKSDSYYRFKHRHQTHSTIGNQIEHLVPPRIQAKLQQQFSWFYRTFYSGMAAV